MGRGIAREAQTGKKCSCDNPQWEHEYIKVNQRTGEITYRLNCRNCKAFWATKSSDARKYWNDDMDKIPTIWMGYTYNGKLTVRELFKNLDADRLKYLEAIHNDNIKKLEKAKKEVEKSKRAIDKFKKEVGNV